MTLSKWDEKYINPLVGKTVTKVELADDQQAIRFTVAGNDKPVVAYADGDCCSYTWIESLDAPENLLGTVQSVEDIDMPDRGQTKENTQKKEYNPEYLAFYGCKITTDKGHCVIDYRNESNGYYGGSLEWNKTDHYGGVYSQNKSSEKWKVITPEEK